MPTPSEASICNRALIRVGQQQLINSLGESTTQAQLCKALYYDTRDQLLEDSPWPWATKHATLALLDGVSRSGWQHAYALPSDCLKAQYVFSGARPGAVAAVVPRDWLLASGLVTTVALLPAINGRVPKVPFTVESSDDGNGRILLTDQDSAELIYTRKLTSPVAMPALFRDALAWRLAVDLALGLPKKATLAPGFERKAEEAKLRALASAFREGREDPPADSAFISVRG